MVTTVNVKYKVFFGGLISLSLLVGGLRAATEAVVPMRIGTTASAAKRAGNKKVTIISFMEDSGKREVYICCNDFETGSKPGERDDRYVFGQLVEEEQGRGAIEGKWSAIRITDESTIFVPYDCRSSFASDICEADAKNLGKVARSGVLGWGKHRPAGTLSHKIHPMESVDLNSGSPRVRLSGLEGLSDMQLFYGVCALVCDVLFDAVFVPYADGGLRPEFILPPAFSGPLCRCLFNDKLSDQKMRIAPYQADSLASLYNQQCNQTSRLARAWSEWPVLYYLAGECHCALAARLVAEHERGFEVSGVLSGMGQAPTLHEAVEGSLAEFVGRERGGSNLPAYVVSLFKRVEDKLGRHVKCQDYVKELNISLRDKVASNPGALTSLLVLSQSAVEGDNDAKRKVNKRALAMLSFLSTFDEFVCDVCDILQSAEQESAAVTDLIRVITPRAEAARSAQAIRSKELAEQNKLRAAEARDREAAIEAEKLEEERAKNRQAIAAARKRKGFDSDALDMPLLVDDSSSTSGSPQSAPRRLDSRTEEIDSSAV